MFCQVSGECGRRLQGSRQGGPQCPEESTEAEETQDLLAAVTLGTEGLCGTITAQAPPEVCPVTALQCLASGARLSEHSGMAPLGSGCSALLNEGAGPTDVPLPRDWHLSWATGGPLLQLLFAPSHACLLFQTQFMPETQNGTKDCG